MVPSLTRFGFQSTVPIQGFHWLTSVEIGRWRRVKDDHEQEPKESDPVLVMTYDLVEGEDLDEGDAVVLKRPLEDEPALYRKFASLPFDHGTASPFILGKMKEFADAHGWLGRVRYERVVQRVGNDQAAHKYCPWANPCAGGWKMKFVGESFFSWIAAVAQMRLAVTVFDLLQTGDEKEIAKVLKFEPRSAYSFATSDGETISVAASGRWMIDTGRDSGVPKTAIETPHQKSPPIPGRVREPVWERSSRISSNERASVSQVAWEWLLWTVNTQLQENSSPYLTRTQEGKIVQELVSSNLHAAMWGQVFQAITGNKSARSCDACGKWYEIFNGPSGNTVRKLYCSDRCRTYASLARKDRAIALARKGMTPKEIVEQISAEGGNSSIENVKKWIKKANK